MNKKLQVFVSSTYTDLIEERQAAVEAILDTGHIPAGMELFKAGKSQMKTICKWIDESDVYMLILGGRYGSIEEESGLSYTELEYKYALSKNMPVFALVLEDSLLFTKAASMGKDVIFEKNNGNKYEVFKDFVKKQIVHFISNKDQISGKIHSQLNDLLDDADYNLIGWIRYNDKNFTMIETDNTHMNTVLKEFNIVLRKSASALSKLLANIRILKEKNIYFNKDWNTLANRIEELYNFYSVNKYYLESCNDELKNMFFIWNNLVAILSNIINKQNCKPTFEDNKSVDTLFNDLNKSLLTLVYISNFTYKF